MKVIRGRGGARANAAALAIAATVVVAAPPAFAERIGASFAGQMPAIKITPEPSNSGSEAARNPADARKNAVGGEAFLRCRLAAEGSISECRVIDESPPGQGFGEAALARAEHVLSPPRGIAGPWPKTVIVPFVFAVPGAEAEPAGGSHRPSGWERTPTGVDMARVFPFRAMRADQEGWAMIKCASTAEGTLTGCKALAEEPEGWGFGQAAIALATKFKLRGALGEASGLEPGLSVRIPIFFRLPSR